jgi:hypothetical protein
MVQKEFISSAFSQNLTIFLYILEIVYSTVNAGLQNTRENYRKINDGFSNNYEGSLIQITIERNFFQCEFIWVHVYNLTYI